MIRGGNWNNNSGNLVASNRNDNDPTNENNNVGFRVAGSWPGRGIGFAPGELTLAARTAEGRCRPRPCRAQEPPDVPAGSDECRFRRKRRGSAAVSSRSGERRGGAISRRRLSAPNS